MAKISGKNGEVTLDSTTVAGCINWTLSYDADVLETTDFASAGVKEYVAGGKGWSGSFNVNKDGAPACMPGNTLAFVGKESQTANQQWSGNIIITNISPNVSHTELVTYAVSFQGTGALTMATA